MIDVIGQAVATVGVLAAPALVPLRLKLAINRTLHRWGF